jgi:4-carboxymuconolactone decarboxylase
MNMLTSRDRELVALGAAMGSNCVPCIEYHIAESKKIGLTEPEIHAVIQHADKIRQVPAKKVLQTALSLLPSVSGKTEDAGSSQECGCGSESEPGDAGTKAAQPSHTMAGMMAQMVGSCGSNAPSAGGQSPAGAGPGAKSQAGKGCC